MTASQSTRAKQEIVYVQRKRPEHIKSGYEMQASDVQAIDSLFERRDHQIRYLYGREKEYVEAYAKVIHSPTFRLAQALAWPAKILRNLFHAE